MSRIVTLLVVCHPVSHHVIAMKIVIGAFSSVCCCWTKIKRSDLIIKKVNPNNKIFDYDFHISQPHNYLNVLFRFVATFLKNYYLAFTSFQSNHRSASFSESFNSTPLWSISSPHPSTLETMSTVNHPNLRFKLLAEPGVSFYEQQPCHKNKIRSTAHICILRF